MQDEVFLTRLRERLRGVRVPERPTDLPLTPASGDGRLFERFAEELPKVGGQARRVRPGELAGVVAELAAGAGAAVVASGLGAHRDAVLEGLATAGCAAEEPTRERAATADLGVTGAALGVASTGSVLIPMGPDAPRVASLLPPLHVVVIDEDRLVPGFGELFEQMADLSLGRAQTVLVTGPSRTADIELSIVRGVHGPERMVVLVVANGTE